MSDSEYRQGVDAVDGRKQENTYNRVAGGTGSVRVWVWEGQSWRIIRKWKRLEGRNPTMGKNNNPSGK